MNVPRTRVLAFLVLASSSPASIAGQQTVPTVRGLLTGYGAVQYTARPEEDFQNDFTASVSPLLLYQVGDDLLFESEVDVELEDGATSVHMEHAQLHYLGLDRLQFTAGMFHIPFSIWMHANWVNRMPTPPLLYRDTHGAPPHDALLPILFDVGVMARATLPVGDGWTTAAALWVSQGPSDEIEAHDHGSEPPADEPESPAPRLGFGANFEDNNSDKMVGLQLRAVSPFGLTLQASGFRAAYDHDGDLGVYGTSFSAIWAPGPHQDPLFDLRGEGVLLGQEYLDGTAVETANYGGYFVQLSKRLGGWEPVTRWSQLPQSAVGEGILVEGRRQLALGLNYWLAPSVPLKASYEVELDGTDSLFLEWAVGF